MEDELDKPSFLRRLAKRKKIDDTDDKQPDEDDNGFGDLARKRRK
jgi:hypothetical protein